MIAIAACSGAAAFSPAATCAAAPSGQLMAMLPDGFSSANCQEKDPAVAGAVERVMCDHSTDPSGPSYALFMLFTSPGDMASAFQTGPSGSGYTLASSCPGGNASPGTWGYGSSNAAAGQVECATSVENNPTVIWTDNAKLRIGLVEGRDGAALYQWWRQRS